MSYYRDKGYRIEETARFDEKQKNYVRGYHIRLEFHDTPVVQDGMFTSKEEAEEFAEDNIQTLKKLFKEQEEASQ